MDPLRASAGAANPQTWNRYSYGLNNPLRYTDPSGTNANDIGTAEDQKRKEQEQQQPTDNHRTRTNGNPADEAIDKALAKILTDGKNGIVVGVSADDNVLKGDTHFRTAGGLFHTVHVFGDKSGNKIVGVYAPEAFSEITYEGGDEGIVSATNPKTGEVLGFAHVDVRSKADLQKNNRITNDEGSRLLGNIGGPGAPGPGDRHVHITYYKSAQDRATARSNKPANDSEMGDFGSKTAQHFKDFRKLAPK